MERANTPSRLIPEAEQLSRTQQNSRARQVSCSAGNAPMHGANRSISQAFHGFMLTASC
ncbi:MAG: hypothetical protein FWG75_03785 [Cystobacterineae bacterium]|nr:hypothetical protein [Cystobacterineae bacterium]